MCLYRTDVENAIDGTSNDEAERKIGTKSSLVLSVGKIEL